MLKFYAFETLMDTLDMYWKFQIGPKRQTHITKLHEDRDERVCSKRTIYSDVSYEKFAAEIRNPHSPLAGIDVINEGKSTFWKHFDLKPSK